MATKKKILRTSTSSPEIPDPVKDYCNDVLSGKIVTGKLVKLACKRHLDDLRDGPARGLEWDLTAAMRAINFFPDVLRLAEGEHAGRPFVLEPWQKFIVGSLFGWKDWKESNGFRRFGNAFIEIGKGNGKSPMAGGIGLYMMTADGENGAHCFAAATTREQAGILFQDAVKMVASSPALKPRILLSGKSHVFNLAHLASGSFFRTVSSEGKGLDGKRVHYAALDEIHEHPNGVVVNKMRAGTKGRRQALIFEITNSGFDKESVCWDHHEYSQAILEGRMPNDAWFAYVCQLDEKDDWKDEAVWPKANPNLGVSISLKYLREQVKEAIGMPAKQNIVRRLNFCEWTEQEEIWMPAEVWEACAAEFSEQTLFRQRGIGGLDLAATQDIAAFVLIFPDKDVIRLLPYFWIPKDGVARRAEKHGVPYQAWIDAGFIEVTQGGSIDYDFIRKRINELKKQFNFKQIAYDPWNATQIAGQLEGDGFEPVEIRQGYQTMNEPTKALMSLSLERRIRHNNNPVMNWMMGNMVITQDPAGNVKPDKTSKKRKIDGPVALLDALALHVRQPIKTSVYEQRGLQSL